MKAGVIFQMSVGILGGLGVFLYGMRVMSQGLESVGGEKMRALLQRFTKNPLSALMTGLMVTCLIQSSSATTVMLVSLVHAGFLNLTQAIGVVLGANIGTTLTGWIVAILGFKIKISKFALPAVAFGVLLIFISRRGTRRSIWGEILVGFGLLFLGLMFMKGAVKHLQKSPELLALLHAYSANGIGSILVTVLIGSFVTVVIQSSSATMALTMTLAQQGVIDFPTAAALILGENIGTTVTANLAALGTDIAARRTARAHFVFNMCGVVWAVIFFGGLLWFVDQLIPGDPFSKVASVRNSAIASHMAAFHTSFNIINTILFLPLVGFLAKVAVKMVPGTQTPEEEHQVLFLDTGIMSTPSLAMTAVRKELDRMTQHASRMFENVMKLFAQPDQNAAELVKEIEKSEELIDNLEREVTRYLADLSRSEISVNTSEEVGSAMHIAHNLEKIGDHNEALLRLLRRKYQREISFSEAACNEIEELADKVRTFLAMLKQHMLDPQDFIKEAISIEETIDKMRGDLRDAHIARISEGKCNVEAGLLFIDMLTNFEKIGDYAFNIAEYLSDKRKRA